MHFRGSYIGLREEPIKTSDDCEEKKMDSWELMDMYMDSELSDSELSFTRWILKIHYMPKWS